MSNHPISYATLIDYILGELAPENSAVVAQHVTRCAQCTSTVQLSDALRAIFLHDDLVTPHPQTLAKAKAIYANARAQSRRSFDFSVRRAGLVGALMLLIGFAVVFIAQAWQMRGSITTNVSPKTLNIKQATANVVISQVYGGGGGNGATFTHDYVELFNRGDTPVSLAGWSLQYASAIGNDNFGASATQITELAGTLAPGQYLLIEQARGAGGTLPLPLPDVIDASPINLSPTSGKIALVNHPTPLKCNGASNPCSPSALDSIVDLVGYGKADFFEGSAPAPAGSNVNAIVRVRNGCVDTDNNADDFVVGLPNPHNSTAPHVICAK